MLHAVLRCRPELRLLLRLLSATFVRFERAAKGVPRAASSALNSISIKPSMFCPCPLTSPQSLLTALFTRPASTNRADPVERRSDARLGCWRNLACRTALIRSNLIDCQLGTTSQTYKPWAAIAANAGVGAARIQSRTAGFRAFPA